MPLSLRCHLRWLLLRQACTKCVTEGNLDHLLVGRPLLGRSFEDFVTSSLPQRIKNPAILRGKPQPLHRPLEILPVCEAPLASVPNQGAVLPQLHLANADTLFCLDGFPLEPGSTHRIRNCGDEGLAENRDDESDKHLDCGMSNGVAGRP